MNLRNKRKIAASMLKVGFGRVWFDQNRLNDIKEAITKDDLRRVLAGGAILVKQKKGVSRGRFRKVLTQKRKGRRSGPGSRKGIMTARLSRKTIWVDNIRSQRDLFRKLLKSAVITDKVYGMLRKKAKGGFFRSRRHIKLFLTENKLWRDKNEGRKSTDTRL